MRRWALLTAAAFLIGSATAGCGAYTDPATAGAPAAATRAPARPAATTRPTGTGGCTRAASTTSARSGQIGAGTFLADQIDAVRYGQAKLWIKLETPHSSAAAC